MDSKTCNKVGRMIIWCRSCNGWVSTDPSKWDGKCQKCGEPIAVWKCSRCGNEWRSRKFNWIPRVCSKCRSPYYNRERVRKEE